MASSQDSSPRNVNCRPGVREGTRAHARILLTQEEVTDKDGHGDGGAALPAIVEETATEAATVVDGETLVAVAGDDPTVAVGVSSHSSPTASTTSTDSAEEEPHDLITGVKRLRAREDPQANKRNKGEPPAKPFAKPPAKPPAKPLTKSPAKSPAKSPVDPLAKSPAKTTAKTSTKTSAKTSARGEGQAPPQYSPTTQARTAAYQDMLRKVALGTYSHIHTAPAAAFAVGTALPALPASPTPATAAPTTPATAAPTTLAIAAAPTLATAAAPTLATAAPTILAIAAPPIPATAAPTTLAIAAAPTPTTAAVPIRAPRGAGLVGDLVDASLSEEVEGY
ncbi:hypothetical protein B484DRAFT_472537 [Ochromonadaceae sp. CCMP2298]|nr:hypothetical protein B484DRAFT_472537 [Ochromonadaceae sp. CCMP2298]